MANTVFNIFSTREIASGFWLAIFIVYVFISKLTRETALGVIKVACSKKLMIPFWVMVTYASILTYLFSKSTLWEYNYIKDITIWVLFVGVPVCFGAVSRNIENNYFKNIIIDNLKLTVLVEFFLSSFTFTILAEIILLPVLTFLYLLYAVAETKEEYRPAKKLISWFLAFVGILIFGFTLKHAIKEYVSFSVTNGLVSFVLPLILSVLYMPIAYLFAVYAKYEIVFIRMSFKEPEDKKIRRMHRWEFFKACALSYPKILRFEREVVKNMYRMMDNDEFNALVKDFRAGKKACI